jgi:hypothetical protein
MPGIINYILIAATMKTIEELKQKISLFDFATAHGYVWDKKAGYKWPVLKHPSGDKIILVNATQRTQGYFNPHDDKDKGSIIQFVKNRLGTLFPTDVFKNDWYNVFIILNRHLNIPLADRKQVESLHKPRTKKNMPGPAFNDLLIRLSNYNYLSSRKLTTETLFSNLFDGRIFNYTCFSKKEYIAFPYFNDEGKIGGVEIRNDDFKMFHKGSNRSSCIWHSNIEADIKKLCLFESPIDALSFFQLYGWNDTLYVAFGGQIGEEQIVTLKKIIEKLTNRVNIFCCFDNDEAGETYFNKMLRFFDSAQWLKPEKGKDFNEELLYKQAPTQRSGKLRF